MKITSKYTEIQLNQVNWMFLNFKNKSCYLYIVEKPTIIYFPKNMPNSVFSIISNQISQKALGRFWWNNFFLILGRPSLRPTMSHLLRIVKKNWPLLEGCANIFLVTTSFFTYGILPPEAVTVCCARRPQYLRVTGVPIRGRKSPQLLVAGGYKVL